MYSCRAARLKSTLVVVWDQRVVGETGSKGEERLHSNMTTYNRSGMNSSEIDEHDLRSYVFDVAMLERGTFNQPRDQIILHIRQSNEFAN